MNLETKFEATQGQETVTYPEGIAYFQFLADQFPEVDMREMGSTDSGYPLHLVLFSADRDFDIQSLRDRNKSIILINNAIHPGEPDGVDASMMLLRDLAQDEKAKEKYKDIILAVIPFYNIGGALNRNSFSRANQNGPASYGFRGNAQNLDLNRDFIKNDSKNAKSFAEIYHLLDPDVFIDNHVSNGADYQYVMTMLATQKNKLGGPLGKYLETQMMPKLEQEMIGRKAEMIPYVNVWNTTPDEGYEQFIDWPRYSTGYTTLFHTIGFVPETHMLKPYLERVAATYAFMESVMQVVADDAALIRKLRNEIKNAVKSQKEFVIDWKLDTNEFKVMAFKGYEGSYVESKVTGQHRLYYDRKKPYEKTIPFYNHYVAKNTVEKPKAYIIPQGWHGVIERLKLNQVEMHRMDNDTTIEVQAYFVADFKTVERPYEGHYLHYETEVREENVPIKFLKGDYIMYANQAANRYLVETLEPEAPDSFFNWNFFDAILQQKEGYSAYVFEDLALELLQENPDLKEQFEDKKVSDQEFAKNGRAQLDFIYKNSPYYEPAHLRYPVYRLM